MEPVKRVEIITLSIQVEPLCRKLKKAGAPGFTILPEAQGAGQRGVRRGDELTGVSGNSVILVACPESALESILAAVGPVLRDYGGVCLVSDAHCLKH
ncbi:MAG: P-II family nitrogen regulator [Opitutales bacterium]